MTQTLSQELEYRTKTFTCPSCTFTILYPYFKKKGEVLIKINCPKCGRLMELTKNLLKTSEEVFNPSRR